MQVPALGTPADGLGGSWDNLHQLRSMSVKTALKDEDIAEDIPTGDVFSVENADSHQTRKRLMMRTTTEALEEHRAHQHAGTHPYRVVLAEVRG